MQTLPVKIPMVYFGCWGRSGHYMWTPFGHHANEDRLPRALQSRAIDCKYPGGDRKEQPVNRARVVVVDGWTVLAFWDRSQDGRGNSNAAFLLEGEHDFARMVFEAERRFPDVFKRIVASGGPIVHEVDAGEQARSRAS
jgi:hypothetical protein